MTIDRPLCWNVLFSLRALVKRILRKYGYSSDKQEKATQTVLEQAEVVSVYVSRFVRHANRAVPNDAIGRAIRRNSGFLRGWEAELPSRDASWIDCLWIERIAQAHLYPSSDPKGLKRLR